MISKEKKAEIVAAYGRTPEDTAHSRIYDRLLSMCVPVRFTGDNFRQETAKRKMESMKKLITD